MKKNISILILLISTVFFFSCGMDADTMLEKFNSEIYENIGGGVYENPEGGSINTNLIEKDAYPASSGGLVKVEVSSAYYGYKWTLVNDATKEEFNISGTNIVYIGKPEVNFKKGESYTLTLTLKNRDGISYSDKTTIKVVS